MGILAFAAVGCSASVDKNSPKNTNTSAAQVEASDEENINSVVNSSIANANENLNTNTEVSESSTSDYVKITTSAAKKTTFIFSADVKASDLTAANISHCVVSTSAGTAGEGEPECTQAGQSNDFSLSYDATTKTLIITDTSADDKWGEGAGAFRIGCASCVAAIKFQNIHTSTGTLLDTQTVTVY